MIDDRVLRAGLLLAMLGLTALAAGCSGGGDQASAGTTGAGTTGAGGSGESAAIAWGSCPDDFLSECAAVPLPLDPSAPDGEALPVFVSRRLAPSGAARAQVWLLQGGPGDSGSVFKDAIEQLWQGVMPDIDWYVLEHRGVGLSGRLACPVQEDPGSEGGADITASEWPACIQALKERWGDDLDHFTTSADAEDLARLIDRTREPGKKVVVYGASYGTTRALRFLQAHPDGADAVILDSIVSPGAQHLSRYDTQYDPVVRDLSEICAADPVCGAKLGPEPWAKLDALFGKLTAGHCAQLGADVGLFASIAPLFVQIPLLRTHLFPLAYRIDRCEPGDVQVVGHYMQTLRDLMSQPGESEPRASVILGTHVALSELWEEPAPTPAELQARCDAQRFCPREALELGALYEAWPRYPHDRFWGGWPGSTVPILAMNGLLDPQTPIGLAELSADELTAPHQTFVAVPWSPHGVAFESPVKTPGAAPCGTQMMAKFIADPEAPIDTTCLDDLVPVAWDEDPAVVEVLFGAKDMWENTASPAHELRRAAPIDWAAVARLARERTRWLGR
ncbi:alpha/beta fold hydrolase [Sorangium sp. So ce128]|uniref:alpha/beta fold hydrolase n=1 Tax=Sorangium sp. So ce128 TaxID=3133281 RepID=UPI003F62B6DC